MLRMALPPAILALLLLSAAAEGRGQSSASIARASTWNPSGLHPTSNTADGRDAAFLSGAIPKKTASASSGSTRLAFLSHLVHSTPKSSSRAQKVHQPRSPTQQAPERRRVRLFSSKAEEADGVDDECNLQRLYQQVQEEDSEWYYQTFSKLLDEDEPEVPPCGDDAEQDVTAVGTSDKGDVGIEGTDVEGDGGEEKSMASNDAGKMEKEASKDEERESLTKASTEAPKEEAELPPTSDDAEPSIDAQQTQQPMRKNKEMEEPALDVVPPLMSSSSKVEAEALSSSDESEDARDDIDRDKDVKYDRESDGMEPPRPQKRIQLEDKKAQAKASDSPPPSRIVRLRNTVTDEIETLAPLPQLMGLGYTERELVVLRPAVLELIVEDGIDRPERGLPKRWVRLNKIDGYEGEEYEEDEEDADWEVEVVARRAAGKTAREQAKNSTGGQREAMEDSIPVPREKDFSRGESDNLKPRTQSKPSSISQTEMRSDKGEDSRLSDSVGPSSRVSGEAMYEMTAARDDESGARRSESSKRPTRPAASEGNMPSGDGYDDERTGDDARRPTPRRRQRQGDEYEGSRSRGSKRQQRPYDDEQQGRRRRRRPPGGRRELVVDRGSFGGEPPPNKFWMDLPTFRDFLRTEAQLRLKILGPDWKESVLDESRWRYDLYKTWLTMLDEGVGENPLYEYGDRPRQPRERRREPRSPDARENGRPTRAQQRRPERGTEDDYDAQEYDRPRRRRSQRPQEGDRRARRRETSAEYDRSPPTPRRSGSTWKNFSDLEESLQRSQMRPESDYDDRGGYRSGEEYDDAPARRRRRMDYYEPYEEEEYDDDDDSSEAQREASSRRKTRDLRKTIDDEPVDDDEEPLEDDVPRRRRKRIPRDELREDDY